MDYDEVKNKWSDYSETWTSLAARQKEIIAALEMKVTDLLMELDRERDQLEWLEQREARDAG